MEGKYTLEQYRAATPATPYYGSKQWLEDTLSTLTPAAELVREWFDTDD